MNQRKPIRVKAVTRKDKVRRLLKTFSDDIYRYAYRKIQNEPDAKDIAQETIRRILEHPGRFPDIRSEDQQWGYLRVVVNRVTQDFISEERIDNQPVLSLNTANQLKFPMEEDWERLVEEKIYYEQLLGKLSDLDKDILLLESLGLTQSEIGAVVGLSRNSVGQHLKKSREQIKAIDEAWRKEWDS